MLIKSVDDKSQIIKNLTQLLNHPKIFPSKKREIKFLIYKIKTGWDNEKKASYYIDTYYKDSKKVVVLHDLRIKYYDLSFQIDHLLIFRTDIVIFESKYFSSQLIYDWKNKSFNIRTKNGIKGIPNPLKQAERQALNLRKFLDKTGLKTFAPEDINFYVLVSPEVFLKTKMPEGIIKADQFIDKFKEEDEKIGFLDGIKRVKNYFTNSFEKISFLGNELKKFHEPLKFEDYLKMLNLSWLIKQ